MAEYADTGAGIGAGLIDLATDVERRQRHIGRRNHFGRGQQIGFEPERLAAEQIAGATETIDHFVWQ